MNRARRGLMLVFAAPSGAGKTTITRRLLDEDRAISLSVSATTRAPRPGEREGEHYFFKDEAAFKAMIAAGALLEHAQVFGNYYGTPAAPVHEALAAGRDVLFDIDWQGARQLTERARADVVSVFLLPPSIVALEARLRARGQDSEAVIARRMREAGAEMSHWAEFDYVLINDDLEETLRAVRAILTAERRRRIRQPELARFAAGLIAEAGEA